MPLDLTRLKVLVVEGSSFMRRITRILLHAYDVRTIHEAENGAEALEVIQSIAPDFVIADLDMPLIDGLELVRIVRRLDFKPDPFVPIIMLSGYPNLGHVLAARDAGVSGFLRTPVSAKVLHDHMVAAMRGPAHLIQTPSGWWRDLVEAPSRQLAGDRLVDAFTSH